MTVREYYAVIGGNYDEAFNRLRSDERLVRFLKRLLDDPTFAQLEEAFTTGNAELAFRASHTLKGVSLNLSLNRLYEAASSLTEALRGKSEIESEARPLFDALKDIYALTTQSIKSL